MQNNKKRDDLTVNHISSQNDMKAVSQKPTGNAGEDPFCVYGHKRHAVGSKISNNDGLEAVCTDEGSWKNTSGSAPGKK
jgi:hypothetical protein